MEGGLELHRPHVCTLVKEAGGPAEEGLGHREKSWGELLNRLKHSSAVNVSVASKPMVACWRACIGLAKDPQIAEDQVGKPEEAVQQVARRVKQK